MEKQLPTIKNPDKELSWYIYTIRINSTLGRKGLDFVDEVNKVLKDGASKKASQENCEELKMYFTYQLAQLEILKPNLSAEAYDEVAEAINDRIAILETGIHPVAEPYHEERRDTSKIGYFDRLELNALERHTKVGYFKNRKPSSNPNTVEGYMRNHIPNIEDYTFYGFVKSKHYDKVKEIYWKTHRSIKKKDGTLEDDEFKVLDRVMVSLVNDFVFVKMYKSKQRQTVQVIEDIYKEDDEFAEATFTVETQNAYATAP